MEISLTINGQKKTENVEPRTLLVDFLRHQIGLTGTHVGCDTSQCGACTVHMNDLSIKACSIFAAQADGQRITTIEGIADPEGELHPMQNAFRENHGLQCGFCTPGMVMSALAIVDRHQDKELTEETVREELEGNLCRCTGYHGIVKAILAGAKAMQGQH
ncbi:MAG: carbon monoxide dehydrogenase [Rhodospirillaceae bacterium]|nr:carbon monoxide dehydrogenase [Rhodospirillaceae bacterium]